MEFIDILIYALACFGLLFTMFSIIETNKCTDYGKYYYVDNIKSEKDSRILVKISGFDSIETDNIINSIKTGNYNNINDIADKVEIIKYN